jgi:hypothetical protein
MIPLALFLLLAGSIYSLIGSVQLVLVMFRVSVWWGLAQFIIPFANIPFMCFHFKEAWPPTKKGLVGLGCIVAAVCLLARTERMHDIIALFGECAAMMEGGGFH